jgi:protein-L-isoaspartate(D-aspartate) O-methyltransferase
MTFDAMNSRFAEARAVMVDSQLRPEGVTDSALLDAMGSIPRECFVPDGLLPIAYSDRAIPLAAGRVMMPPAALAQLIQALTPSPGDRALVIGAGSGYSAAILSAMGVSVTALEPLTPLAAKARDNGVEVVEGKLEAGHKAGAPYDVILIDGGVEQVPETIIAQLADGGRLATILCERGVGRLAVGTRAGKAFGLRPFADTSLPVLPGFARAHTFVF